MRLRGDNLCRVQVSVKCTGRLWREGLHGAYLHTDGETFWKAGGNSMPVEEKEQDESREQQDIRSVQRKKARSRPGRQDCRKG
ncbi:MAG: hypothetical protein NC355_07385 [Blautia sp.]|nr:hypothetical protein [Blautia sp.]